MIEREIISGQKTAQNLALRFRSTTEENVESNHLIDLDWSLTLVSGKQMRILKEVDISSRALVPFSNLLLGLVKQGQQL